MHDDVGEQAEHDGDHSRAAQPWWWCHNVGHPAWCDVEHDRDADPDCRSGWRRAVLLSLADAARGMNATTGELEIDPISLIVSLRHRHRECAPRVSVSPQPAWSGTRYDFTRDEAERISQVVIEAVTVTDGHAIARVQGGQAPLPYWWSHDLEHPRWCRAGHRDCDIDSDRDCWSRQDWTVRPTLPEAARTATQDGEMQVNAVESLQVCLHQAYRECAPRVTITPEHLPDGSTYELTRDEAERLGHALREAVILLDSRP